MIVDGYEVMNSTLADLIDKICEADGSPNNKISYLADAGRMLVYATAEIVEEAAEDSES